jgi:hypothetical protein
MNEPRTISSSDLNGVAGGTCPRLTPAAKRGLIADAAKAANYGTGWHINLPDRSGFFTGSRKTGAETELHGHLLCGEVKDISAD